MKSFVIFLSLIFSSQIFSAEQEFDFLWDNPNQKDNISDINKPGKNTIFHAGPKVNKGTYTLTRDHESKKSVVINLKKTFDKTFNTTTNVSISSSNGAYHLNLPRKTGTFNTSVIENLLLDFSKARDLIEGETEVYTLHLDFNEGEIDITDIQIATDDTELQYKVKRSTFWMDKGIDEEISFAIKD